MTHYSRSNPVLPTTSQNANAVNPSFNQTFASPDTFFIPHPHADGDSAFEAVTSLLKQSARLLSPVS